MRPTRPPFPRALLDQLEQMARPILIRPTGRPAPTGCPISIHFSVPPPVHRTRFPGMKGHTPRYLVAGLDWPENAGNLPFYSLDRRLEWLKKLSQHGPIPPRPHLDCQIRAIVDLPPPAEGG